MEKCRVKGCEAPADPRHFAHDAHGRLAPICDGHVVCDGSKAGYGCGCPEIDEVPLSKEEYLKFLGLVALFNEHKKQCHYLEKVMGNLLHITPDFENYFGHLSDELWCIGDANADLALEKLEIAIPDIFKEE